MSALLMMLLQAVLPLLLKALLERLLKKLPAQLQEVKKAELAGRLRPFVKAREWRKVIRETEAFCCELDEECKKYDT